MQYSPYFVLKRINKNTFTVKAHVSYQKIGIQSAKNAKSAKTAKPNKTEDKINHVSIFPFRKQTICTVTQHTGGGGGRQVADLS